MPTYLKALETLKVSPPFAVMLSLLDVRGARLGMGERSFAFDEPGRIDRNDLELPIQQIEAFSDNQSYKDAIAPAFDALWNAVGFADAQQFLANFDAQGKWIGR